MINSNGTILDLLSRDTVQPRPVRSENTNQHWLGFWQILYESGDEDVVPFRNTTIAMRQTLGFVILTRSHFMEIRTTEKRRSPVGWPPTENEAVTMLRGFSAYAGRYDWKQAGDSLQLDQTITMASDPRLEGSSTRWTASIDDDVCTRRIALIGGEDGSETLQRLSGAGKSPLAGTWETGTANDRWMYLVTAGHYGIIRAESGRPTHPKNGQEFNDTEMYAIWEKFGANAGARLEAKATFDHWPMIAQVAGYEVRKHETFRIESIEPNRFVASIAPNVEPETWHSVEQ